MVWGHASQEMFKNKDHRLRSGDRQGTYPLPTDLYFLRVHCAFTFHPSLWIQTLASCADLTKGENSGCEVLTS